jgi:CheY-like chemotaxis protein
MDRDDTLPTHVFGDESKLRQIMINLLGNAVKFTTSGGVSVRLRADSVTEQPMSATTTDRHRPTKLRLIGEVEDSGPGITEEDGPKIFSIFQQAKAGKIAGGTGLGLSISRDFARIMGGDITYRSQADRGSCFRFEVQLEFADSSLTPVQSEPSQVVGLKPGTSPKRVLIVDDNQENRLLLATLLQPIGFEIMEAADGSEAIQIFEAWSPHVILMDLRMPGMDGYEAIRLLKSTEKGHATPIIAVTASAFEENEKHVMGIGVVAYLRKPFRTEELFFHLGKCLDLQYVFTDEPTSPLQPRQILQQSAILALPSELVEAMRLAVAGGNMARLTELITQVENIDINTAQGLQTLAEEYDYEYLNQLLAKGVTDNE